MSGTRNLGDNLSDLRAQVPPSCLLVTRLRHNLQIRSVGFRENKGEETPFRYSPLPVWITECLHLQIGWHSCLEGLLERNLCADNHPHHL